MPSRVVYRKLKVSGNTVDFEPESKTFFDCAGSLVHLEKIAVNNLFLDLKSANLDTKVYEMWPIVGGTEASHECGFFGNINLRFINFSPADHTSTGVQPDGFTKYAEMDGLDLSAVLTRFSTSFGLYSRTDSDNGFDFGARINNNNSFRVRIGFGADAAFAAHYGTNDGNLTVLGQPDSLGLWVTSRVANNDMQIYRRGVSQGTLATVNTGDLPTSEPYVFCYNQNLNIPTSFSDRESAFFYVGHGMTPADVANLETIVTRYQTALGRNV